MLVRILLLASTGSRQPGHYIVDDIEARALHVQGAELHPAIEPVVPQVDVDDDDAREGAAALAADLFPADGVDLDAETATTNTDEVRQ